MVEVGRDRPGRNFLGVEGSLRRQLMIDLSSTDKDLDPVAQP
jgi:hypothetical protein